MFEWQPSTTKFRSCLITTKSPARSPCFFSPSVFSETSKPITGYSQLPPIKCPYLHGQMVMTGVLTRFRSQRRELAVAAAVAAGC